MAAYDPTLLTDAAVLAVLAGGTGWNDDEDPPSQEAMRNFNAVLMEAARRGLIPDFSDEVDAIGPHFVKDGVRQLINLAIILVNFYGKHKGTIDPLLDLALRLKFQALLDEEANMKLYNQPGPN